MPRLPRPALAIALALLATACFDPTYPVGLPCGPDRFCPSGQTCNIDDICEAEDAFDPLPELILENLETFPGEDCTVDYCVIARNIGCRVAQPHQLRVANELDENFHDVPLLMSGDAVRFCGTLPLDPDAPDPHETTVQAFADWQNDLVECTEDATASSCNAATGRSTAHEIPTPDNVVRAGSYRGRIAGGAGR